MPTIFLIALVYSFCHSQTRLIDYEYKSVRWLNNFWSFCRFCKIFKPFGKLLFGTNFFISPMRRHNEFLITTKKERIIIFVLFWKKVMVLNIVDHSPRAIIESKKVTKIAPKEHLIRVYKKIIERWGSQSRVYFFCFAFLSECVCVMLDVFCRVKLNARCISYALLKNFYLGATRTSDALNNIFSHHTQMIHKNKNVKKEREGLMDGNMWDAQKYPILTNCNQHLCVCWQKKRPLKPFIFRKLNVIN